jgi:hypothetical protein
MKTWAIMAAKHATLTSGISFSAIPGLGTASLDGFALGALLVGAYFAVQNSPRRDLGGTRLPVPASRRQAVALWASRGSVVRIWTRRDRQAGSQPSHTSLASPPLNSVLVRPSFLAAPADLRERQELSARTFVAAPADLRERQELSARTFLAAPADLPERDEMSRPYAMPERHAASGASGADGPAAQLVPSRPSWLPRQAERSEDSRPYALPSSAEPTAASRPDSFPALAGPAAIRRLTRFRRRIDTMLVEMLGDESDEIRPPRHAEPDEGFWGPGERTDSAPKAGYRSKHRLTDPAKEPRRPDGQRGVPRHAAPPASFSARLTGRDTAHAAG